MERLAKLEGVVEGLRLTQTLVVAMIGIVLAAVVGFGVYGLKRTDDLNDKISGLPTQITRDIRELTNTLSSAITASKQQPPQVILLPAPSAPAPVPQPTPAPEPKNP
jgi:hypothetical protein